MNKLEKEELGTLLFCMLYVGAAIILRYLSIQGYYTIIMKSHFFPCSMCSLYPAT